LGAIPGAGIIARGTKRGAAWMDRNLPEGFNRLLDYVYPSDPRSTTNIFAGPTAKTADHAALAKAQEMKAQGASRADIWRETGWDLEKADQVPRFEIDDSAAKLAGENYVGGGVTMYSGLDHPGYAAAYGDQPQTWAYMEPGKSPRGGYFHKDEVDPARIEIIAGNVDDARSVNLHELQHDVQAREGLARGTSIENSRDFADAWIGEVTTKLRTL